MNLNEWYLNNTFHYKQFDIKNLIKIKKRRNVAISLCLPTLNEEQTIGNILKIVKKELYSPGLIDEVVVVDSNSSDSTIEIVKSIGFKVYQHKNILPKYGSYKGKGDALWKSLFVLKGDIIVWCDSDIKNFSSRFVYGLLGPLLTEEDIFFVKAFYRRPLKINGSYMKKEGGRVTKILVRPILNLFYPALSKLIQPLSGEYAGRREILEQIPFFTGYGVEIGMLIEIYEKFGLDNIAQVDVKRRVHRNHPLSTLSRMSFSIMQAIFKKLEYYDKLYISAELNNIYNQIEYNKYSDKKYIITPTKLEERERPPVSEVKEYAAKKKKRLVLEDRK